MTLASRRLRVEGFGCSLRAKLDRVSLRGVDKEDFPVGSTNHRVFVGECAFRPDTIPDEALSG